MMQATAVAVDSRSAETTAAAAAAIAEELPPGQNEVSPWQDQQKDPWQDKDPWQATAAAVDSRSAETMAAAAAPIAEELPPGQNEGIGTWDMVLVTEPASTETADVVAGELGPVLSAGDTPSHGQPPRRVMRDLLLQLTEELGQEHPNPLYRQIENTPATPWHDYLLTLPATTKEVVFQHGGVVEFGVCSFPAEPDPNTGKARVDFVAMIADGVSMVRLHPGKSAKGDAKPIVGRWSQAIQNRLNYARNRARARS